MAAELFSVKRLPSKGKVGSVYFDNVNKEFYIALADGTLFALAGLLGLQPVAAVGPQGERGGVGATGPQGPPGKDGRGSTVPGPRGDSITGPKGADGLPGPAGKDGRDGRDSTITGPQGPQGPCGPKGDKGERGDVMIPNNSELAAAALAYRQRHAAVQAALLEEISKSRDLRPSTRLHVQNALNRVKREAGL
jgi:hypothetical protein